MYKLNLSAVAAAAIFSVTLAGGASAQSEADRIKALESMIQKQQAQIQAQQKALSDMQAALKSVQETSAGNGTGRNRVVLSRDDKVKLSIEGQVNRALLFYDDGNKSAVRHVDNNASSTRLAFNGSAQATDDIKLGATFEVQFESNSSATVNQADNTAVGTNSFTERKLEIYAASNRFGTVTLGHGSTASSGMTGSDLSGTDLVGSSDVADSAGGLSFATAGTGAIVGNPTVGGAFDDLGGLGSDDRLRYDTPNFKGIALSTSSVDGGEWDIAASYAASHSGLEVDSKIGYANQSGTQTFPETILGGSLSVAHNGGLNLTVASARGDDSDSTRDAQNFWYGKIGYIAKDLFRFGTTNVSVDYGHYNNVAANNDEAKSSGLQFVQAISEWGTELYAGFRRYDLDRTGSTFDEIAIVLAGARVRL
ncbi:MAG: porin [Proteobacteria bacterium]|nr:porin [Pseudomonadota bacterium]